jgi:hypothetical protein
MNFENLFAIAIALLTFNLWQFLITGYFKIPIGLNPYKDIYGIKHHARMKELAGRYYSSWTIPISITAVAFLLTPWWAWSEVDDYEILRPIIFIVSGAMAWRAVTMDVELATRTSYPRLRILIILLWVGVWFHPGFLVLFLHTGICWLRSYYHHQHLSIRMMIMFLACLGALPLLDVVNAVLSRSGVVDVTVVSLFLFICLSASTYFVSVMKKMNLGPHWYSWILDNRLHTLVMSAYLWGWLRFLPEKPVISFVKVLRPFDRVLQTYTFLIQLCSLLILFNQTLCIVLMHLFIVFHIMIALLSGIFFWQQIVATAILLWAVINLPPDVAAMLFSIETGLLAAAILVFLPYKKRVWMPVTLGWWDTPLSCRVHYEVRGRSGKWYGLYNDFMCPNERIFGQFYGDFLVKDKRLNMHVGECHSWEQFDAINSIDSDFTNFDLVKEKFGHSRYLPERSKTLDRYIREFFRNYNSGCRKRVVPGWLKAPGGQLFYWGTLPRFKGQEQVDELIIRYREYYFHGNEIHLLTNYKVKEYTASDLHYQQPTSGDS